MTIKGKKLAMTMNGADQVLMQPEDKGGWISDSYVAVKLNNYEYHKFIFRFFNYKKYNKVEHFECEEGETLTIRKDRDKTWSDKTERKVIDSLLIDIPIEKNVEVTDILFKDRENGRILRILQKDNNLLYINENKYGWILDELDGYDTNQKDNGEMGSINIIDGKGNPIAILMPIASGEIGKKVKKELKVLS